MITITPDPIAFQVGPISVGWYGILYVIGISVMALVSQRELERRGIPRGHFLNAVLFVAVCALIGARLYHVIHEWAIYREDLLRIVLPPYSGLALYGGILGALVGIVVYARWKKLPVGLGLDAMIPGTFFAQSIARWGNFFNQELYGPPSDAPWAIAIQCMHRVGVPAAWQCPPGSDPLSAPPPGFHPLFFYESMLTLAGGLIALYLSRRYLHRLRPGDLIAFWSIWYGATRAVLESLRVDFAWTIGTIPTAQLISLGFICFGVGLLVWNHRPGRPADEPYTPAPPPDAAQPPEASAEEA